VSHGLLLDPRWVAGMLALDVALADEVRSAGCPCGGRLHRASYPRKPRGLLPGFDVEALSRRTSFCCHRDGCRERATPPSVVFLGRRVYAGAAVVLGAALRHGPTPWRLQQIVALLGVSLRTLRRWLVWWRTTFTATLLWRTLQGRLALRDGEAAGRLPRSLLEAAGEGDPGAALERVMTWLLPITSHTPLPPGSRFAMLF